MLEEQQSQLTIGLRVLYHRLINGQPWPGDPLKTANDGHPLTLDILERLGISEPNSDPRAHDKTAPVQVEESALVQKRTANSSEKSESHEDMSQKSPDLASDHRTPSSVVPSDHPSPGCLLEPKCSAVTETPSTLSNFGFELSPGTVDPPAERAKTAPVGLSKCSPSVELAGISSQYDFSQKHVKQAYERSMSDQTQASSKPEAFQPTAELATSKHTETAGEETSFQLTPGINQSCSHAPVSLMDIRPPVPVEAHRSQSTGPSNLLYTNQFPQPQKPIWDRYAFPGGADYFPANNQKTPFLPMALDPLVSGVDDVLGASQWQLFLPGLMDSNGWENDFDICIK